MSASKIRSELPIGEIAAESGLSIHTLRYYERIGLIAPVARAHSGHRRYNQETLERIEALSYLRASGMSIEDMRTYLSNLLRGDAAAMDHAELLEAHSEKLRAELTALTVRQNYIAAKAAFWRTAAESGRDDPEAQAHLDRARSLAQLLRSGDSND
jgi:DNA-binding transcriptional MerR regulator